MLINKELKYRHVVVDDDDDDYQQNKNSSSNKTFFNSFLYEHCFTNQSINQSRHT